MFDLGNFNFERLKWLICSGEKEWDDGVVDVILSELEMVTLNANKLDLLGFVESLETESVVLVEVTVLECLNIAIRVELLEPLGLLRIHHSVLSEHHEHSAVESSELGLSGFLDISLLSLFLIVEVRKEDASIHVLLLMPDVTEVSSGSDHVLDETGIDEVAGNCVDDLAEGSLEAVGDVRDAHVGTTNRGPVADLTLDRAALDDVTSEKGTLRKSHDVDLISIGKGFVSLELCACFLGLVHEVVGHGGDGAVADLEALGVVVGVLGNLLGEAVHAGVDAGITETVEDGGRDSSGGCGEKSSGKGGSHG